MIIVAEHGNSTGDNVYETVNSTELMGLPYIDIFDQDERPFVRADALGIQSEYMLDKKTVAWLLGPKGRIYEVFGFTSVGSDSNSDIYLDDTSIAENHCLIFLKKMKWYICANDGCLVIVNGERLETRQEFLLPVNSEITIGSMSFSFSNSFL